MRPSDLALPFGTVGRADLLRALSVGPRKRLMLDSDGNSWFGYVRDSEAPSPGTVVGAGHTAARIEFRVTDPAHKVPLRMPFVHGVVERYARPQTPKGETPSIDQTAAEPIDEEAAKAPSDKRFVEYEDLVPQARLLPALRRQVGYTQDGDLDTERLVRCLAVQRLPRHLPRRRQQRWHPELVVVLDFSQRLWPFRADMHRLAERLLRHCGRSGISLRIVNHGPFGTWSDWAAHQDDRRVSQPPERTWRMPPAGTPVLIVGDLGLLLGPHSEAGRVWQRFIAKLLKAQVRPVVLAPLGTAQLDDALPDCIPILRWSPDSRMRPEKARGTGRPVPDGLDDLLAMAAITRRVDPPLLRAMRKMNPKAPLNAGLEGAFWCHSDVQAGGSAAVRHEEQERHLKRFARLQGRLRTEMEKLRFKHHAHLRAALNHEETLLWQAYCHSNSDDWPAETRQRVEEARVFMSRLAATLRQPGSLKSAGVWWSVAQGIVQRADQTFGETQSALLMPIVAALAEQGITPPDWADPAELAKVIAGDEEPEPCWLVADAPSGSLLLQREGAGHRQALLTDPLLLDKGGARLRLGEGLTSRTFWISSRDLPYRLAPLAETASIRLATARQSMVVAAISRPRGAASWGYDKGRTFVQSPTLCGHAAKWDGSELTAVPSDATTRTTSAWNVEATPKEFAAGPHALVKFGLGGHFGVWAELVLSTSHGTAIQRFRYIEPGTFLMGSPQEETDDLTQDEAEKSWFEPEHPRHPVTLTRGYWLADTPCTQALWQAVTGENPSYFKSPNRPVERVGLNDVQGFLRRLEEYLPGVRADLPTEAEWEYACRAGTETALYTGPMEILGLYNAPALDPIAWYGGNSGVGFELDDGFDSGDWPAKQYADSPSGTHPVGRTQPNPWGLYDMLGNVWEWCGDGPRVYTAEPVVDPEGVDEQRSHRAARGGSWYSNARNARAACRSSGDPGYDSDDLGFRLCLRSMEPDPVRSDGTPGPATRGTSRDIPPWEAIIRATVQQAPPRRKMHRKKRG